MLQKINLTQMVDQLRDFISKRIVFGINVDGTFGLQVYSRFDAASSGASEDLRKLRKIRRVLSGDPDARKPPKIVIAAEKSER